MLRRSQCCNYRRFSSY